MTMDSFITSCSFYCVEVTVGPWTLSRCSLLLCRSDSATMDSFITVCSLLLCRSDSVTMDSFITARSVLLFVVVAVLVVVKC